MPSDQPGGPPQRGWKNNAPPPGAPKKGAPAWRGTDGPAGPDKGGPAWKGQGAAPTPRQPWSKKTKIVTAAALIGLVMAVLAWVVFWPDPPRPFRLILLTAGNESNLAVPHNVFGRHAAAKLAAWGEANPKFIEVHNKALTGDLSTLEEALKGKPSETVVVVIAAHGAADETGAYLIPEDADLRDRARSRVPLEKIVDRLARLPGETKKLLVLDATQPAPHWPLALAHNDFARRVESMEQRFKDAGLLVLCSTEPDQRSWVSEEWGQSIFAHHFLDGLRGAADLDGNDRVMVDELAEFVRTKVEQWARQTRGSLQTPKLYGYQDDASGMQLVRVEAGFQPADPAKAVAPELPGKPLQQAWERCQQLAEGAPHSPAVLTPHLWRYYLEALLRYEELLRAGSGEAAARMLTRAQGLETRIRSAQNRTDLFSATGSLAMPVALGWDAGPAVAAARKKELQTLWGKEEPLPIVRKKLAAWLEAEEAGWPRELLRVRLGGLLLDHAIADPGEKLTNFKSVYSLLSGSDSPLRASPRAVPQPTELYHLLLLGNPENRIKGLPWEHVKKSLELARTAEQAALGLGGKKADDLPPSSDRVLPWIRQRIQDGDAARRPGQDLLFASKQELWEEAADLLAKARSAYADAQELARRARHALLWRDRALAELPYYSRWLACERFLTADEMREYNRLVNENLGLWKKVNRLDRFLQEPDPARLEDTPKGGKEESVPKVASEVQEDFTKLRERFERSYGDPFDAILQSNWHKLDNLLAVPFIPAEQRVALLGKMRRLSEQLTRAAREAGKEGMNKDQTLKLAREQARAHGELMLTALGEDAFQVDKELDFARIRAWIRDSGEEVWHKQLPQGTDQIQQRLARLPGVLDGQIVESRKQGLKAALPAVRAAASWARRLPGAEVFLLATSPDPLEELRCLELHDLLCWQADRALEDFYGPTETPFYQRAGLIYVTDARTEVSRGGETPARQQRVNTLKAALNDEGRKLAIARSLDGKKFEVSAEPVSLTDEKFVSLYYRVQAASGVPEGKPVLWAELQKKTSPSTLRIAGETGRQVLPIGPKVKLAPVNYPLERTGLIGRPSKEEAIQLVHGLFRGHRFLARTPVNSFELPDTAVSMPELPPFGNVAVQTTADIHRGYASGTGTVVIVFDCSDSMNQKGDDSGRSRLRVAAEALGKVLKVIPAGTQVSLWVFSQKFDVTNPGVVVNVAEDSIQRLFFAPADKWDPKGSLPDRWQQRVEGLMGYNYTPIVHSIMKAKVDFAKRKGPKTLIVLTDGMDTRFKDNPYDRKWTGDPVYNPGGKLQVGDFLLREFKESDIALRVVGFQLSDTEEPIAKRQFKEPLEKLKRGRFYTVKNLDDLTEALKEALKQSLFFSVQHQSGQLFKGGIDIPIEYKDFHWVRLSSNASSGSYKVVLESPNLTQNVFINPGDRIRLNLNREGDGFKLVRDEVLKSHPGREGKRPSELNQNKDWRLTVLQNQDRGAQGERAAHLTVTAEKLTEREFRGAGTVTQVTPRLILFQVSQADDSKAPLPTLRYYRLGDYVAPAWRLEVKPWTAKQKPVVEAFWTEGRPATADTLLPGVHFRKGPEALPDAPEVELGQGRRARLLSLGVEKFLVDQYDKETGRLIPNRQLLRDCLVVRLQYAPGKPVLVRPPEEIAGQEHRFFSQAGKYTGIFWPVPANLTGLDVVSVDEFREDARRRGNHVRIPLEYPNDDPAPTPQ
ncbi:MAG: hypothetical protein L0Z62_13480 [Gemmataceae bacterium]|nr:hypothetical protein [Gemmataceae bacterium]